MADFEIKGSTVGGIRSFYVDGREIRFEERKPILIDLLVNHYKSEVGLTETQLFNQLEVLNQVDSIKAQETANHIVKRLNAAFGLDES